MSDAASDRITATWAPNQRYLLAIRSYGSLTQRSGTAASDGTIDETDLTGGPITDSTVQVWCVTPRGDRVRIQQGGLVAPRKAEPRTGRCLGAGAA